MLQNHSVDLKHVLVPAVVVIGLLLLLGFLGYKYRVGQMLAHMKMGLEKRAPPGAEREVTLVLTDIQVGGVHLVMAKKVKV